MSDLEAAVQKLRRIAEPFIAFTEVAAICDITVGAEARAKAAEKRLEQATHALAANKTELEATLKETMAAKDLAKAMIVDAKAEANEIKKDAKTKAEAAIAKARLQAQDTDREYAIALEKFKAQKETNDEILAMTGAQIAHGEAKLSEIRAAIAAITASTKA